MHVTHRKLVRALKLGLVVLKALYELYPEDVKFVKSGGRLYLDLLLGTTSWRDAVVGGRLDEFVTPAEEEAERFREAVKPYTLYG